MIKVYQLSSGTMKNILPQSPFMYNKEESKFFDLDKHLGSYEHVADLDTDDLQKAFEIGNIGPEEAYTRYKPMHSLSVGDILVKDGVAHIVADFGFDKLENVNL